ncbi:TPA: hypothetical protein N0F65_002024 [Lagenidium giganteum]|uniref:Uncharacterized protein n=1 Tax=Lagenidium giganteum TaxID=4803 RepID=A0AAV2Z0T1_9STRA|nr:TPA: hypothetical protein N0F65_002024 [Lagenidium giganteum]
MPLLENSQYDTFATSRVQWVVRPSFQLIVNDDDQLIRLPASSTFDTGVGRRGQPLVLCRRPSLVKQRKKIDKCAVKTYALLWIVGPPGVVLLWRSRVRSIVRSGM